MKAQPLVVLALALVGCAAAPVAPVVAPTPALAELAEREPFSPAPLAFSGRSLASASPVIAELPLPDGFGGLQLSHPGDPSAEPTPAPIPLILACGLCVRRHLHWADPPATLDTRLP